jgi:hypothetical protein
MAGFDAATLRAAAYEATGDFICSDECSAGSVGAALMTEAGEVFAGICIDALQSRHLRRACGHRRDAQALPDAHPRNRRRR